MKLRHYWVWVLIPSVACSRAGNTGDAAQAPASSTELRGKVVITGTEPATSVRLVMSEGNVELVGSLESELRRLAGASVIARGSLQGRRPAQRLEVRAYEITDIDGEVPATGVLQRRDGHLWLAGKDTLKLIEAPEPLRAKAGAKVWIVGPRSGAELAVQSYGVIRE
jgi:hypothetical protein